MRIRFVRSCYYDVKDYVVDDCDYDHCCGGDESSKIENLKEKWKMNN